MDYQNKSKQRLNDGWIVFPIRVTALLLWPTAFLYYKWIIHPTMANVTFHIIKELAQLDRWFLVVKYNLENRWLKVLDINQIADGCSLSSSWWEPIQRENSKYFDREKFSVVNQSLVYQPLIKQMDLDDINVKESQQKSTSFHVYKAGQSIWWKSNRWS